MSKILVVEPRRILQQALRLALCPDHEVLLDANLSDKEPAAVKDFDLAIIDAAALREGNVPSTQVLRAVQAWKIPKIWIDEAERVQTPTRNEFRVLTKPIEKDALQAAVAICLEAASASKQNGTHSLPPKETPRSTRTAASDSSPTREATIIELVDVVEESPEPKTRNQQQRKTR
jgi:DNA-binding NtrC family response regulator